MSCNVGHKSAYMYIMSISISEFFTLQVQVYVNKVGPYFNVHETYHYYEIPVCTPEKVSFDLIVVSLYVGEREGREEGGRRIEEIAYNNPSSAI